MVRHLAVVLAALVASHAFAQTIDDFDPSLQTGPTTLALQADGKIIIAGNFLDVGTTARERVARLNVDGSLDTTFADPLVDSEVKTVAVQPDGKILIGGGFDSVGGSVRKGVARLNSDGSLDTSFADPGFDSAVWALAIQPDGAILAAGDFQNIGTHAQKYFARVTSNGAFDASFADPQFCCSVARSVALQADGHVLIAGYFSQVHGASHFYFARFSSAGVYDSTFPADNASPSPSGIVVAPDSSIYFAASGQEKMIKLTATGAVVAAFNSAVADSTINTFVLQPNGKIVIAGIFANVAGQPRHGMARLNADGSLDTTFGDVAFGATAANPNGEIFAIAEQNDGGIVASGNFTLASGQTRQYMARAQTGDAVNHSLTAVASGSNSLVTWTRTGDGSELIAPPVLYHSPDGVTFTALTAMSRIANGWQETAPYNINGAPFYLRAEGYASAGAVDGSVTRVTSPVFVSDRIFANGFDN